MADRGSLILMARVLKTPLRRRRQRTRRGTAIYDVRLLGAKAAGCLMMIYPLLRNEARRRQAFDAIRSWKARGTGPGLKTHCPAGHPYAIFGQTGTQQGGRYQHRSCRECARLHQAKHRARLRGEVAGPATRTGTTDGDYGTRPFFPCQGKTLPSPLACGPEVKARGPGRAAPHWVLLRPIVVGYSTSSPPDASNRPCPGSRSGSGAPQSPRGRLARRRHVAKRATAPRSAGVGRSPLSTAPVAGGVVGLAERETHAPVGALAQRHAPPRPRLPRGPAGAPR
jgi:hypothetical protein